MGPEYFRTVHTSESAAYGFQRWNTLRILSSGSKPELPQVKMHHLVGAKDSHQEQRETSAKYKHVNVAYKNKNK